MTAIPTVSVIIAVRNGAATLERAVDSVLEQTYEPIELIVMDGASTDGTVDILRRYADRIAYWESEPDRGIYHAWNKALDRASGEWIQFLGADDRFHAPDVLARLAPALAQAAPDHRVVYGRLRVVRSDSGIDVLGAAWDADAFRDHMTTPHPATFHHRSLFQRHGRFDERYAIAGDYEYLLRELIHHDPQFVPILIVDMGGGGVSNRPSSRAILAREAHRARYTHGLVPVPEWRSGSVIRTVARTWLAKVVGQRVTAWVAGAYRRVGRVLDRGRW